MVDETSRDWRGGGSWWLVKQVETGGVGVVGETSRDWRGGGSWWLVKQVETGGEGIVDGW